MASTGSPAGMPSEAGPMRARASALVSELTSPDGLGQPALLRLLQADTHGVQPAELVDDVPLEVDRDARSALVPAAHHTHQGRPDEEVEADHRGDRVAWKAEQAGLAARTVEQGLARLELDAPEDLLHPKV